MKVINHARDFSDGTLPCNQTVSNISFTYFFFARETVEISEKGTLEQNWQIIPGSHKLVPGLKQKPLYQDHFLEKLSLGG